MPLAGEQLCSPWATPARRLVRHGVFRGTLAYQDVAYELTVTGPVVQLAFASERNSFVPLREHYVIQLDLGPSPDCWVEEQTVCKKRKTRLEWTMCAQGEWQPGPFSTAADWALSRLFGFRAEKEIWRHDEVLRVLACLAEETCELALSSADPSALDVALRFHPSVRLFVYAAVFAGGERMSQCAHTCPGLLILLWRLERWNSESTATVYRAIEGGRRLNAVIDLAVRVWQGADVTGAEDIEPARQRVFIRRAPHSVAPDALLQPLRAGADLGDIPAEPQALLLWYEVVTTLFRSELWSRAPGRVARDVTGFFSRHAQALVLNAHESQQSITTAVSEIVHYVLRSGAAAPNRRCDVSRVLLDVARWHLESWSYSRFPPDMALARCNLPRPTPPLEATQLESVEALVAEGEAMQHCVATQAEEAAEGRVYIFSIRYAGERLTAAVESVGPAFRLVELSGQRNREASGEAFARIQEWIANQE